jgi:hypothetical protein
MSETDGRQKARTVCTIGTQPVIPAVYGVKAPVGAIVRAFAAERRELLRNFESQRLATLEWATAERREAIADVRRELAGAIDALRGERAVVVDDLRHIVDVVLLRVAVSFVAGLCAAGTAARKLAISTNVFVPPAQGRATTSIHVKCRSEPEIVNKRSGERSCFGTRSYGVPPE